MGCICKDCGISYHGFDGKMVMLKDDLWEKISDNVKDTICDVCIEIRLGRKINRSDFKLFLDEEIPVNKNYCRLKCI